MNNLSPLNVIMLMSGAVLIYCGVKGKTPMSVIHEAMGKTPNDFIPGTGRGPGSAANKVGGSVREGNVSTRKTGKTDGSQSQEMPFQSPSN